MVRPTQWRQAPVKQPGPVNDTPPPAARVKARRMTHWRDGGLVLGFGLIGFGWVSSQASSAMAASVLAVAVLVAGTLVAFGERNRQRRGLEDKVLEALAETLEVPYLDRRTVKFGRWSSGWPGRPLRIRIFYAPVALDISPEWKADIVDVLERRLLTRYKITAHDQLRCRLRLEKDDSVIETTEQPARLTRALRSLGRLIDQSVTLLDYQLDDDGELKSIKVKHDASDKMAAAGAQTRVERIISTMHAGRWRGHWDTVNDEVTLEQRPSLPSSVWLPAKPPADVEDLLANYDRVAIPYAIDEDGEEIVWHPAVVPHFLITGGTGSGKTSTTHAIVGEITQYGWPVWVLDGKRVEFLKHRTWPNVQVIATTVPQQVALVHRVWMLMQERYRLMEDEGFETSDFEPLVVVLDEWAEFVGELADWYGTVKAKGDPTKPPTIREEASLARKARTARIHLIKTMQRPDVSLLGGAGGEARSNYGQRASIGRIDPQGATMMWNNPATGTTIPRAVRQRAITTNAEGTPVEAQCYRFPSMSAAEETEEGQLRGALRPAEAKWPRLLILPPEQDNLDDDGSGTTDPPPLTFWDYAETDWVRADARPDLDPVVQAERRRSRDDARMAASTMAVLGLRPNELSRPLGGGSGAGTDAVPGADEKYVDDYDRSVDLNDFTGYQAPMQVLPFDLQIGDLIQVDDAEGWAVVDEQPEEDVLEPSQVAVSWRDDSDQRGSVSLERDTRITVRRPEEIE